MRKHHCHLVKLSRKRSPVEEDCSSKAQQCHSHPRQRHHPKWLPQHNRTTGHKKPPPHPRTSLASRKTETPSEECTSSQHRQIIQITPHQPTQNNHHHFQSQPRYTTAQSTLPTEAQADILSNANIATTTTSTTAATLTPPDPAPRPHHLPPHRHRRQRRPVSVTAAPSSASAARDVIKRPNHAGQAPRIALPPLSREI